VRTHAIYLTRQADAQLRQGHLEQACATAGEALDLVESISSRRTVGPLGDLAEQLSQYKEVPTAREFRERARAALAA
jgi:cobalamin biosynthesis protein CbiD